MIPICLIAPIFILFEFIEGVSVKNEKTGATELCMVKILKKNECLKPLMIFPCQITDHNKVAESVGINNKEKCATFCEMTEKCRYWTWYRRHCDR